MTTDKPDVFMIAMSDHEVSKKYALVCNKSWTDHGFKVLHVEATTPKSLKGELSRFPYIRFNDVKHTVGSKGKPFTDTEKSIFLSHFRCWLSCIAGNTPVIVAEHDAMCTGQPIEKTYDHPLVVLCRTEKRKNHLGEQYVLPLPAGAYYVTPLAASMLIFRALSKINTANVDSVIDWVLWRTWRPQIKRYDLYREAVKPYCCAKQIVVDKWGTTIDHEK